jgi:cytochrome c biogenesis protein
MIGVLMSYVSHSQIWALQQGDRLWIGGRTNRAQVAFERELIGILEEIEGDAREMTAEEAVTGSLT